MSETGSGTADKERIRQAVHKLTEGTGFQAQELANEMVITNPQDLDNGQLHVDFEHGYMSWERVVWEYFGAVVAGLGEEGTRLVTRETIEGLLGT